MRWRLTEEDTMHQPLASTGSCTQTCTDMNTYTTHTSHVYMSHLLNALQAPIHVSPVLPLSEWS